MFRARGVPGLRFHRGGFYCTDEGQEVTIRDKGLQKDGTFAVMRASNLHGDATPLLDADKTITVAHYRSLHSLTVNVFAESQGWMGTVESALSIPRGNNLCRVPRCKPSVGTSGSGLGATPSVSTLPPRIPIHTYKATYIENWETKAR